MEKQTEKKQVDRIIDRHIIDVHRPLVSAVVVTYNSCETVIETLDSIKAQTYENLELIISDDCSTDQTVLACKDWVALNDARFKKCTILTSQSNQGTSRNANKAILASRGDWVKAIAGDDKLLDICIERNVEYVLNHSDVDFLFSRMEPFGSRESFTKVMKRFHYGFFLLSPRQQYLRLLIKNTAPAPSLFLRKKSFLDLGCYDESIPLMEDWPFWLKTLQNGYKLSFMNLVTVYYRVGNSLTTSGSYSPTYRQTMSVFSRLLNSCRLKENVAYRAHYWCYEKRKNGNCLYLFILQAVNPISWYYKYIFYRESRFDKTLSYSIREGI